MHVILDGLHSSANFDFKVHVFLFEVDDGSFQNIYFVSKIYLFIIQLLYGH